MPRATWMGLLLALCIPAVAGAMAAPVEASMVVTGTVTMDAAGKVTSFTLNERDKLPPGVAQLVDASVAQWAFKPIVVDGKPVAARTFAAIRLVAEQGKDGKFRAHVQGASFARSTKQALDPGACTDDTCIAYLDTRPLPAYPLALMAVDGQPGGTVYLTLQIDRAGRVARIAVRQVNVDQHFRTAADANWARKAMASLAMDAVRHWTFRVPTRGPEAAHDSWIVSIPIDYVSDHGVPADDAWQVYIPGPVHPVPWDQEDPPATSTADIIPRNGLFQRDPRFVLLTPLGQAQTLPVAAADAGQG